MASGIDLIDPGLEQQICLGRVEEPAIFLRCAWIRGEVLLWPELQRIDEYADDHAIGRITRLADEANVPVVQVPHRRHEGDLVILSPPARHALAKRSNACELVHFRSSARARDNCDPSPLARSSVPPARDCRRPP